MYKSYPRKGITYHLKIGLPWLTAGVIGYLLLMALGL